MIFLIILYIIGAFYTGYYLIHDYKLFLNVNGFFNNFVVSYAFFTCCFGWIIALPILYVFFKEKQ